MEVILLERIEKLGQMGDVVTVKPGFARNYLLPQKKALRATEKNRTQFEQQRSQLEVANLEQRGEAEQVAGRIEGLKVVIVRQASDSDQLYGSVTVRNIAQAVTEAGFSIDSKQVQLTRPIKMVGLHDVRVVLHPEVAVNVVANVARSEEEAELQAAGKRVSAAGDDEDDEVPETDTEPPAGAVESDDAKPPSSSEDPESEDPESEDEVRTEDGSG